MKTVGVTVLVTVAAVLALLAMYGAYRAVDARISHNKEQACLEQVSERTIDRLEKDAPKYYSETDPSFSKHIDSLLQDVDRAADELCKN